MRIYITAILLLFLSACGKAQLSVTEQVNAPLGIGIKGYDPVAYHLNGAPVKGAETYQSVFDGVRYLFASKRHKERFDAMPQVYLPAYGGYCAYAMSGGRAVDINPKNWSVVDGQLYLNANSFAEALWHLDKPWHIENADRNWATLKPRSDE